MDLPPATIDIILVRTFDREQREELLCGKKVSVKLSVERESLPRLRMGLTERS